MTTKHLEIKAQLGRWAIMHGGEALATFDTEEEAALAAQAVARTQPAGDDAEVTPSRDPQAAFPRSSAPN